MTHAKDTTFKKSLLTLSLLTLSLAACNTEKPLEQDLLPQLPPKPEPAHLDRNRLLLEAEMTDLRITLDDNIREIRHELALQTNEEGDLPENENQELEQAFLEGAPPSLTVYYGENEGEIEGIKALKFSTGFEAWAKSSTYYYEDGSVYYIKQSIEGREDNPSDLHNFYNENGEEVHIDFDPPIDPDRAVDLAENPDDINDEELQMLFKF